MKKELQDYVWHKCCLPKEFKEEVKKLYTDALDASNSPHEPDDRKWGNYRVALLEKLFGIHNLTSDADGEEMLTVSRKKVQEMYAFNEDILFLDSPHKGARLLKAKLHELFGSKCLPDDTKDDAMGGAKEPNVDSSKPNVDSSHDNVDSSRGNVDSLEPNPDGLNEDNFAKSEPKFKVGDIVTHKNSPHIWRCVTAIMSDGTYVLDGEIYDVEESHLEPYTEPEEDHIEENLEMVKDFDNILKDSFREHNRLQIAAMAMHGILANSDEVYRAETCTEAKQTPQAIAKYALACANALIAECERADKPRRE